MIIKKYSDFSKIDRPFWIFGSSDSQDYDVLVSVEDIPQDVDKAHDICKIYNSKISELLPDKPLNCNLGVFKEGELVKVFKGTVDELNNCIYYTYNNHQQFYPNPIESPVKRDIDEKILRVARFIITFYSRTHLRPQIKAALRGDLRLKLDVLKQLDFTKMREFTGKKEKPEDVWKVIAFQFGQVFSLIDGYESDSYTKDGIKKNYSDLSSFLSRKSLDDTDFAILNEYLNRFISLIEERINNIRLTEFEIDK